MITYCPVCDRIMRGNLAALSHMRAHARMCELVEGAWSPDGVTFAFPEGEWRPFRHGYYRQSGENMIRARRRFLRARWIGKGPMPEAQRSRAFAPDVCAFAGCDKPAWGASDYCTAHMPECLRVAHPWYSARSEPHSTEAGRTITHGEALAIGLGHLICGQDASGACACGLTRGVVMERGCNTLCPVTYPEGRR